jgi:hypothetical protein
MAWGKLLTTEETADNTVPLHHAVKPQHPFFDATLFPLTPTIPEPVDQRELDREAIKQNLRDIMTNRFFSETARVAAARELARVVDNEEIAELRSEVARMREIVQATTPDESDLPPHLRTRK